jgi:hypothetical protein
VDLVVLLYAGNNTEGLGNLPQVQQKLKKCKNRAKLPEMVLLHWNEVLPSPSDVENPCLKFVKACGKLWPRRTMVEKDDFPCCGD